MRPAPKFHKGDIILDTAIAKGCYFRVLEEGVWSERTNKYHYRTVGIEHPENRTNGCVGIEFGFQTERDHELAPESAVKLESEKLQLQIDATVKHLRELREQQNTALLKEKYGDYEEILAKQLMLDDQFWDNHTEQYRKVVGIEQSPFATYEILITLEGKSEFYKRKTALVKIKKRV